MDTHRNASKAPSGRGKVVRRASSLRAATAAIRQIAALGLPGTLAAPRIFECLHDCLRYGNAGIVWVGEDGVVDGYFHGSSELRALVPTYASEFMGKREAEVMLPLPEALATEFGPTPMSHALRVSRAHFYRHDYYGVLMQPFGMDFGIRWILRHADGRPIGMMVIGRPVGEGDFSDAELTLLRELQAHVATALSLQTDAATRPAEVLVGEAAILCGGDGRVRNATADAAQLLCLWFGPQTVLRAGEPLPAPLSRLAMRLSALRRGDPAPPARLDQATRWGRFSAHAEPMVLDDDTDPACLLRLRHHVPQTLVLLDGLRALALPPQQAAVCLHLAEGLTEREIAARLDLSMHTVTHYRRLIYNRLGIGDRGELRPRLLEAASTATAH
jgi:DNA-binding CsgD family transcriptional regulator